MTYRDPSELMPALFIGHGSPMNALADNEFTRCWVKLARRIPRPDAIVCVSAHWETKGVLITAAEQQRTIHDFYNFPRELYEVSYPAPGAPQLARSIEAMLAPHARADLDSWGLDHGTWSILRFMYPQADIPVVQVSQDIRRSPAGHYEIGKAIGALRREKVLILGSGNIVHNLSRSRGATQPFEWAVRFNDFVKERIAAHDHEALIDYRCYGEDALLSVPEAEHYQPLLYVLATRQPPETAEILTDVIMGALSMTSVAIGLGR